MTDVSHGMPQGVLDPGQVERLLDLEAMRHEALHPDLEPYVEQGSLGPMLRHPLVYEVPLLVNGIANRRYAVARKALKQAEDQNDMDRCVALHERPYRLRALIEYVTGHDEHGDLIPLSALPQDSRNLAAWVWTDSENIDQHLDEWESLFSEWYRGDPMLFCQSPQAWAQLPDRLTVYRAGIDDGGWSWTLDAKIASFFARRFGARHPMSVGKVDKADVFGHLTSRGEAEVLVLDGAVTEVEPYLEAESTTTEETT